MSETRLKFYHYYFRNLPKPVTIETTGNKQVARELLRQNLRQLPSAYKESNIESETVSTPVTGVTTKNEGGKTLVWQGVKGWQQQPATNTPK